MMKGGCGPTKLLHALTFITCKVEKMCLKLQYSVLINVFKCTVHVHVRVIIEYSLPKLSGTQAVMKLYCKCLHYASN